MVRCSLKLLLSGVWTPAQNILQMRISSGLCHVTRNINHISLQKLELLLVLTLSTGRRTGVSQLVANVQQIPIRNEYTKEKGYIICEIIFDWFSTWPSFLQIFPTLMDYSIPFQKPEMEGHFMLESLIFFFCLINHFSIEKWRTKEIVSSLVGFW